MKGNDPDVDGAGYIATATSSGALVTPTLLGLGPYPDVFDADGNPNEANIQWKVGQVVRELTHFSRGGI